MTEIAEQPAIDTPAAPEAPPEQPAAAVAQAPPPAEDTLESIEADLESNAIELPEGDKLVPLSAVSRLREKLKDAKQGSAEAATLKQQLELAQQQNAALAPLAEAFRALQQAGPMVQPQQVHQPPPAEDTTELEEIARDFDFYKGDGTPDLDKARRHQTRTIATAHRIAQQQTAPLVQDTLAGRASQNISRAKNTTLPGTDQRADADIIDHLAQTIAAQPGGLATLANPDAMKQVWLNAYGLTQIRRQTQNGGQPAVQQPPTQQAAQTPPVMVERVNQPIPQPKGLSTLEQKAARDAGLSEKEYLDIAKGMKW